MVVLVLHAAGEQARAFEDVRRAVGVAAAPYVVIVTGGGPASAEGIRAKWRAVTDTAPAGSIAFHVSSIPTGGEAVDVGQLTLKIALPAATK